MTRVYVGIGSNYQREFHIRAAVRALRGVYKRVVLSSVYASEAVEGLTGEFFNLVVGFDTQRSVEEVKRTLGNIETAYGRCRGGSSTFRISVDLDLLLFGKRHGHLNGVRLPRSDVERYAFVLGPLAEIAGRECHPVTGKSYQEMWERFPRESQPLRKITWSNLPLADNSKRNGSRGTEAMAARQAVRMITSAAVIPRQSRSAS